MKLYSLAYMAAFSVNIHNIVAKKSILVKNMQVIPDYGFCLLPISSFNLGLDIILQLLFFFQWIKI